MSTSPSADRRQHLRFPLAMSIHFQHMPSRREFPARCVDVSKGGLFLYVPASAPVAVGHDISLTLADIKNPQVGELSGRTLRASVVHVDRHMLLPMGHLAMGVKFEYASEATASQA